MMSVSLSAKGSGLVRGALLSLKFSDQMAHTLNKSHHNTSPNFAQHRPYAVKIRLEKHCDVLFLEMCAITDYRMHVSGK